MRHFRRIHRTVIPASISMAVVAATFLAGCPKGNVPALSITPFVPAVGDAVTILLIRETTGHFPARDGLYAISLSRPPEITPENPTPTQPSDAGVKLGDMVLVDGRGEFRTILQPTYGPDKYGTVLRLEPGTQINLEIRGPSFSMTRGLPIGVKQGAPSPGASPHP